VCRWCCGHDMQNNSTPRHVSQWRERHSWTNIEYTTTRQYTESSETDVSIT